MRNHLTGRYEEGLENKVFTGLKAAAFGIR